MTTPVELITITKDQLRAMITEAVQVTMQSCLGNVVERMNKAIATMNPDKPLNREDVMKLLKVHRSTLIRWEKEGLLIPQRQGRKAYFDRSEIDALVRKRSDRNYTAA